MRHAIWFGVAVLSCLWAVNSFAQYDYYLDGATLPGDSGWTVELDVGVIVDLGDGNHGIQQRDADISPTSGIHGKPYDEYYLTLSDISGTLATRFRVDSYEIDPQFADRPINPIALTMGGSPTPAVGVGIRNVDGADRWQLLRFVAEAQADPPLPEHYLADLGPVVLAEFNEARIFIDNETDLVRFFWNNAEVYNAITPADIDLGPTGYPEFGASNYWGEGGISEFTYDWVGYGDGFIPGESPAVPGDTDADNDVDLDDLNAVRNHFGESGSPVSGDTSPFDGDVDLDDLNAVRNNFGATGAAVPEPGALLLAAIGIAGLACRRGSSSSNRVFP